MSLRKALITVPEGACQTVQASFVGAYFLAGAAVGVLEAISGEALALRVRYNEFAAHSVQCVHARFAQATSNLYYASGALVGTCQGIRGAWTLLTEDEITMRLMQGSPIKYRVVFTSSDSLQLLPSIVC